MARRGITPIHGHGRAAKRYERSRCVELGVEVLTLYTFSAENRRPQAEVAA
jgi:undecaprenyl diphosphate synthase